MTSVWQAGNWFKALAAAAATLLFHSKFVGGFSSSDYPYCAGTVSFIEDGDCDPVNNNSYCDYDGGDCCWCTCDSTYSYTCGDYNCIDPSAYCVDDDDSGDSSKLGVIIGVSVGVAALLIIVAAVAYCICSRKSSTAGKTPPALPAGQAGHPVPAPATVVYPAHAPAPVGYPANASAPVGYPAHAPATAVYQMPM